MQSGFAMLESAYVQPNGSANIMMKNMMDLFVGAVAYLLWGYEIAHGATHATSFMDPGWTILTGFAVSHMRPRRRQSTVERWQGGFPSGPMLSCPPS